MIGITLVKSLYCFMAIFVVINYYDLSWRLYVCRTRGFIPFYSFEPDLRMSLDDNHISVILACAKVIQCILSCDVNECFFNISEVGLKYSLFCFHEIDFITL